MLIDFLFKNSGSRIKYLAVAVFGVTMLFLIMVFSIILISGQPLGFLYGIIILCIGFIFAWIFSIVIYAFGELCESVFEIKEILKKADYSSMMPPKKRTSQTNAKAIPPSNAYNCPKCGARVYGNENFCTKCGAKISQISHF